VGNHAPSRTSLRERLRANRSIVVVSATGAVLIAAGTAGAAAVNGLTGPGAATAAAGPPAAETADARPAPQASESAHSPKQDEQTHQEREQAIEAATQSFSGTTSQKEKPESEPAGDSSGSGGSDLTPSGQGGSCEASMYSEPQPTASGEQFDPSAMTAAHKSLPMDTKVQVTNPDNGKSVTVRINDRGPYIAGRCLDLSTASFTQIASSSAGVVDVEWQVVS